MKLLDPGRRIWVRIAGEGEDKATPYIAGPFVIIRFKRFLPAGPVAATDPPSYDGIRKRSLVQVFTDPGGLRTLAVAEIWLKDPGRVAA